MIRCQNLKLHLFQPVLFCNMNHEKISKIIFSFILSVSSIIIINDYCRNYFFYGGKIIQIRKVKITKTKQCTVGLYGLDPVKICNMSVCICQYSKVVFASPQTQNSCESQSARQIIHLDTCPEPETPDGLQLAIENFKIVDDRIEPFCAVRAVPDQNGKNDARYRKLPMA